LRQAENADELFAVSSAEESLLHGLGKVGSHCHAVRLFPEHTTGWVMGSCSGEEKPVRLCWLPTERRGYIHAVWGSTVVIGAHTGVITILDLSAMLTTLDHAGVRPKHRQVLYVKCLDDFVPDIQAIWAHSV
jgi:hypothetical protein